MLYASIVVSFGLVMGSVVSWMAEEELISGVRYFRLVANVILVIMAIVLGYYYTPLSLLLIPLLLAALYFKNTLVSYLVFALVFAVSYDDTTKFLILASLMFLYGFPMAALFLAKKTKIEFFKKHSGFKPRQFISYLISLSVPGIIFFAAANIFGLF